MKSVLVIDKNNKYSEYDEIFLMNSGLTNWRGWLCSVGQTNLEIEKDGQIHGGNCKQKIHYGNLHTSAFTFTPTKDLTICTQSICKCFHDISIYKIKDSSYTDKKPVTQSTINEFVKVLPVENHYDFNITWVLHTKCNFSCSYCPPHLHSEKVIDKDKIDIGFTNFINTFSDRKIMLNFLGGEPTLYDELPDKIKEIKKLNSDNRILITTNGSRSFKYLRELAKYAEISFSVHLHQLSLDKLADKINNLSVFDDIQPFQVHVIYPSDSDNKLKQFLSKLTSKNYYIRVIKIRKQYEDQRKDYYNYSLKQENLINNINKYFENLN